MAALRQGPGNALGKGGVGGSDSSGSTGKGKGKNKGWEVVFRMYRRASWLRQRSEGVTEELIAVENELEAIVKSGIKFSDIFEYAKPANGTCPQGFKSVNTGSALQECLKLKVRQSAACWHVPISAGTRWCSMGTCDWAAS